MTPVHPSPYSAESGPIERPIHWAIVLQGDPSTTPASYSGDCNGILQILLDLKNESARTEVIIYQSRKLTVMFIVIIYEMSCSARLVKGFKVMR